MVALGFIRLLAVILVFCTIIFVHELFHYLVGRWCGVKATCFSIGFGPEIFGRTDKRGTYWRLALFPVGGYVKFLGQENLFSAREGQERGAFWAAKAWQRFLIVLAGPAANFLFSFLVFVLLFWWQGSLGIAPVVGEVLPEKPAAQLLKKGDRFYSINGKKVEDFFTLRSIIWQNPQKQLRAVIEREGKKITVLITPIKEKGAPLAQAVGGVIGILPPLKDGKLDKNYCTQRHFSFLQANQQAFWQLQNILQLSWQGLKALWQTKDGHCNMMGPARTAQLAWKVSADGFAALCKLAAYLSLSLGVMNLLPVFPLDGGYLLFFGVEIVLRRPLPAFLRVVLMNLGIAFVFLLIALALVNDFLAC